MQHDINYQFTQLRKKGKGRKLIRYSIGIGILLLLIGGAYFFMYSDFFKVKEFKVQGLKETAPEEFLAQLKPLVLDTQRGAILGTEHYVAWQEGLAYQDVRYAKIEISKDFVSRTITITATPRKQYASWCQYLTAFTQTDGEALYQPECFWMDETGLIFEHSPIPEGQLVMRIDEAEPGSKIHIGEFAVRQEMIPRIRAIIDAVTKMELPIKTITVYRDLDELRVKTLGETTIAFSLRFDPATTAIPAMERFLSDGKLSTLDYLDLTVENRAFYRPR